MQPPNAAGNLMTAVAMIERPRRASTQRKPMHVQMTGAELAQGVAVIESVIRARRKLQLLRNRAEALESALARFKQRREAQRA